MSSERHASSNSASPQETAMFLDILHEAPLFGHRKPRSIVGGVFYCFILASYAILAAAAPWIFRPIENFVLPLLCSCDVVLLIVTGIFQQYLVYQVQKIRLQGYYSFSQKLKHIVRLPFAITAYGTAAMMLVMVWKTYISILSTSVILSFTLQFELELLMLLIAGTVRIIMLVEAVCSGFFMSVYIGYVHQYNSLDSQPDVLKSLYSPLQPSSPLEDLRYHDGGRLSDQQMALLQYQRENLHFLSEEVLYWTTVTQILRLQECLSKYEGSNDGSTPQVDLAHLLAARDQELRTVSAEMNQLQSELRLARSLMAERDAEVQRVRTTNNQYVEENERLRAILGEWSTRAAKLERALEVERMSNLELQKKISTLRSSAHTSAGTSEQRGT
ncbi:FRIGIDA interacting protein 1 [Theobroma cacao]|uniref:FRIGIDA interacting protein 1 n=1 Tax=Theobroma cacao TaxID=3641 RepID=A0A061GLI5_THECC|nr:FRIGIDA interacting protein 1 [Theobroma cacao]